MKKQLSAVLLTAFALLGVISTMHALPTRAQDAILLGETHNYTVTFRGNGEAIVLARLTVTNPNESPMTEYSFQIPKAAASELSIYQQQRQGPCIRYATDPFTGASQKTCLEYGDDTIDSTNYYNSYNSGSNNNQYYKIQYQQSGTLYRFTLPKSVQPYKTTTLILSYSSRAYAKNVLGLYSFSFETLKVPYRIQKVRVAVDVDTDLYMKGKRSQVNYAQTGGVNVDFPQEFAGFSSKQMDTVVGSIGTTGPLVKEAKNLAPNESLTVRGQYAASAWRLYVKSIVITIIVVVLIIYGIYLFSKRTRKKIGANTIAATQGPVTPGTIVQMQTANASAVSWVSMINIHNTLFGFSSAVLVFLLSYFIPYADHYISWLGNNPFMTIIFLIMLFILYLALIFGPAIYVGSTYRWKGFAMVMVMELIGYILIFIFFAVLFQSGLMPKYPNYY